MRPSNTHANLVKDHFEHKYYDYDILIRKLIPHYALMHRKIIRLFKNNFNNPVRFLDLGIGTGFTSRYLLDAYPGASIDGIDISPRMIRYARQKLRLFGKQVSYRNEDFYSSKLRSEYYDGVAAVLSIHHLTDRQKEIFFKRVYSSLTSKGVFIICDLIRFPSKWETLQKERQWRKHLVEQLGETEAAYWFENSHEEDIPATIPNQIKWMKFSGFQNILCAYRYMNYAVLIGIKG